MRLFDHLEFCDDVFEFFVGLLEVELLLELESLLRFRRTARLIVSNGSTRTSSFRKQNKFEFHKTEECNILKATLLGNAFYFSILFS
jgi:hypothetical protein